MTQLSDNAEDVRSNFGYTAIFTPGTGSPVTVKCEYEEQTEEQPTGYDSRVRAITRRITFLRADLAAEPNEDETFTIGSAVYKVKTIEETDNWFQTVGVTTS